MKQILLPLLLLFCFSKTQEKIVLKTQFGDNVVVTNDIIYYNNQPISKKIEGIIYSSQYNRLIEQKGIVFLFIEIDNTPNYNNLSAYKLTKDKANKIVECVYNDNTHGIGQSPFTDMDEDGKIEFGGFDITEEYESKDSMYYNPSIYYELNNGIISFDSLLAKKMDVRVNGIYLSKPLNKNKGCCVVIKKPEKKSSR